MASHEEKLKAFKEAIDHLEKVCRRKTRTEEVVRRCMRALRDAETVCVDIWDHMDCTQKSTYYLKSQRAMDTAADIVIQMNSNIHTTSQALSESIPLARMGTRTTIMSPPIVRSGQLRKRDSSTITPLDRRFRQKTTKKACLHLSFGEEEETGEDIAERPATEERGRNEEARRNETNHN